MNNIKMFLVCAALSVASVAVSPVMAQTELSEGAFPTIVAPHKQTVSYRERTLCYDITANVPFTVTADVSWVKFRQTDDGTVYVHLDANNTPAPRVAHIVFANADNNLRETLVLTQGRDESVEEVPTDVRIYPSSATDNNHNANLSIALTYDNDESTFYHTQWEGSKFVVSESNPAILTYNFENVDRIDYVEYLTRQDDAANGYFGDVEVYVKKAGESDYTLYKTVDWQQRKGAYQLTFEDGLLNPASIQFRVLSGSGDFASCAEMRFMLKSTDALFDVFTDGSLSELKEGVTEADIDNIDDDFTANLARQLLEGDYQKDYRVAEYAAKLDYVTQSEMWGTDGKYYDQRQGVTGINITKGKHAVAVSGLPDGTSVPLSVTAWYTGKIHDNFQGGDPRTETFSLHNGLNIIDYKGDYDGLAYVCYYAKVNPELQPKIKVHFVNGQVNGYLSQDKTNEEMHELLAKAPNMHMDVVSHKTHSVWTSRGIHESYVGNSGSTLQANSDGLYGACVADDRTSLGYRQYMNVLDSLVDWEHDLLGFTKYGRVPDNRTFAYVNYTYYMFQGSNGVSFHVDQENRILNCYNLIHSDNDLIWGLSHEWGHQHQMIPYFCWKGTAEVTNNMNSYYNIMRMGYRTSDKINQWIPARRHFVQADYSDITRASENRANAYSNRNNGTLSGYPNLIAKCAEMQDNNITDYADDPTKALSFHEVSVGETLCPFIMVYAYFTTHGVPDFGPDFYESMRQIEDENGSQIEKKSSEPDKYEMIATIQNSNKGGRYTAFTQKYPESCWVKKGYISANSYSDQNSVPFILNYIRKCSRLSGYNLFPYFERWGYLRQIAMLIGDYGNGFYIMTKDMYDEFKEDMDALVESGELKEMPEGMVEDISNCPDMFQNTPTFPN